MDGADHTSRWSSVLDARRAFLSENKHLTKLDAITDLDLHGRLHAVIIEAYDGDAAHGPCSFYTLHRRAGYGQIKPMFYFDHRFA